MGTNGRSHPEWIETWIRDWSDKLTRYAWQMTGDRQLAQDVAQETFLRLYVFHARHPMRDITPSWLFTVAKNVARDLLRSTHATSPLVDAEMVEDSTSFAAPLGVAVQDILTRLAPDDRECLYLFYYADLSTDDIARHLGSDP